MGTYFPGFQTITGKIDDENVQVVGKSNFAIHPQTKFGRQSLTLLQHPAEHKSKIASAVLHPRWSARGNSRRSGCHSVLAFGPPHFSSPPSNLWSKLGTLESSWSWRGKASNRCDRGAQGSAGSVGKRADQALRWGCRGRRKSLWADAPCIILSFRRYRLHGSLALPYPSPDKIQKEETLLCCR